MHRQFIKNKLQIFQIMYLPINTNIIKIAQKLIISKKLSLKPYIYGNQKNNKKLYAM